MKNGYFLFLLCVMVLTSCQREDTTSEKEKQLSENILPISKTYSWENYKTGSSFGEVLYLPVYSSIYHQSDRTFDLTATLSIHNADLFSQITVKKIDYYNTNGALVRSFIKDEFVLNALKSKQFIISQTDISGGNAAKFIIQWISENKVTKPIVEAVMISTSSQQGISFKTESRVISSIGY